jgi:hypothetical protein
MVLTQGFVHYTAIQPEYLGHARMTAATPVVHQHKYVTNFARNIP